MRISCIAAVAALLVAAPSAEGQWTESVPRPRFSVSAFTGARAPFTTGGMNVLGEEGNLLFSTREQRGGNAVLGVEGEVRVAGPVSVVGGATYSQGGIGEFFIDRDTGFQDRGDFGIRYLSDSWFFKAGASVHFEGGRRVEDSRTLPSTDITVAPALVRQFDTNHPALNLGFEGSIPVTGSRVGITAGIEDYMVFWDDDALRPVMVEIARGVAADAADAEFLYRTSHVLVLRLGATMRF